MATVPFENYRHFLPLSINTSEMVKATFEKLNYLSGKKIVIKKALKGD